MPVELGAEFRHLDLAVVDIADDERTKDFLNLPVDRLENVDLGWGHRPVFLLAYTLASGCGPHSVHNLVRSVVEVICRDHVEAGVP